ncbi:radical SAM protein [Thermodesulfobacteriota bacterium]
MSLIVNEIFYSIQGESTYAGLPCVFVRLTGCNMRCAYCDTVYAYDQGRPMHISEILDSIGAFHCSMVEITGGEPLLQAETPDLISSLLRKQYRVLMETNGSLDVRMADPQCVKIMDVKCPGSGEHEKCDLRNFRHLGKRDQVKFVIGDRQDYDYAKKMLKKIPSSISTGNLLFSPISNKLAPAELAGWLLEDHLEARLHLQIHRVVWPEIERGV